MHTEVVLTPQSKEGVVGEGAGGVSIHSKFSSEVDLFILLMLAEFCKMQSAKTAESGTQLPSRNGETGTLSEQSSDRDPSVASLNHLQ